MAISKYLKCLSISSIVIGCLLLMLTLISVVCGGLVVNNIIDPPAYARVGLWGLYFAVPGVFCIVAGVKKKPILFAIASGTNILGIILAIVGLFFRILSSHDDCYPETLCRNSETVDKASTAVILTFIMLACVTFIGSIHEAIGTCSALQEPAVVVSTVQPCRMEMTTQSNQAYNEPPPPYDLVDIKTQQ